LYLITTYILMPLSAPKVLNGAIQAHGKTDAVLSSPFYFMSSISMVSHTDYADMPPLKGYILATAVSALMVVASMEAFRKLEYVLKH